MTARLARLVAALRRHQPTGRHTPANGEQHLVAPEQRVPADWTPLDPRFIQRIAPTYYATRPVHADIDQPTGIYNLEVTQ